MLLDYLETSIVRKVKLIYLLFYSDQQNIDYLALQLNCTATTLLEDVCYLQNELDIPLNVISTIDESDNIILEKEQITFNEILNRIYKTSYFLKFLVHFFNKDSGTYAHFIASHHVSTATGYRLRKSIVKFLGDLDLTLKNNVISGNTTVIRLLAVELQINFGFSMIAVSEETKLRCVSLLSHVEELLDIRFSEHEKYLFNLLMQTSIDNPFPCGPVFFSQCHLESINSKLTPFEFRQLAQEYFSKDWQGRINEETDFAVLALIAINSHIFETDSSSARLAFSRQAFMQNPEINRLVALISEKFTIDPQLHDYFYTSIYLFLRDSCFDLQPIGLGNYIYLKEPDTVAYQEFKNTLQRWNIHNINFNKYHIYTLYNRLAPALSISLYDNVIIISDKHIDTSFLQKYIHVLMNVPINVTIENQIHRSDPRLTDKRSIYIIDKNANIALPLDLITNCFHTNFPMSNSQTYQLLDQLNLVY